MTIFLICLTVWAVSGIVAGLAAIFHDQDSVTIGDVVLGVFLGSVCAPVSVWVALTGSFKVQNIVIWRRR